MPRPAAILALCLLAMALAACGEKDETDTTEAVATTESTIAATNTTTADPVPPPGSGGGKKISTLERIERTIQAVVGDADPDAACSDLVAKQYVTKAYGDEQGCRAAVAGQPTFEVSVKADTLEIDDTLAGVKAIPRGGPNKGETLSVSLEQQGSGWKVATLRSNAPAGP